jgi:sigma-E factor negative regulatory protein RseB
MNQTLERGNYEGTFVFMHNNSVETMSIVHGYSDDNGIREKLVSLTGDAREVIRDQDVLTCIWPRDKLVVIETASATHGLPSTLPTNLNELAFHYKLIEVGQARIAGHDCTIVRFEPLDDLRYGHELCLESKQGMVLESKTIDKSGAVIENMMFTSFRMRKSVPEKLFQPSVHLNDYTWKTASVELNGELQPDQAWKIKELPPGFSLQSVSRRLMSASNNPVQHMVLTDGLASVSVFISKVDDPKSMYTGAHKQGVINAYARDLNQHQITVVGEVPEGTVKMIGSSVIYANP